MSIELGCAPASPKTVAGADKTAVKSKVKSGEDADAPPEGGFAAILTSLDSQAEKIADADTPATAPEPVQQVAPSDSASVLTKPDESEKDKLDALNIAASTGLPNEIARLLGQGGGGDKLMGGVQPAALTADKLARLGTDKASDLRQNVQALLDQMAQGLQGITHKTGGLDGKSGAAASLAESRVQQQVALTDAVSKEPAISSALLTSGLGEGFVRLADRGGSKTSLQSGASGMEGSWGQSAFQAVNNTDAPSVLIDPSTQSFEATVADSVSFWVKQGVQNAELKLDGLDGESIAVSISLKGDEAHIGFRTDKSETRQMLEGAVAHLKDLLTSEGLVLSGVSVGTSGKDGAGTQEQSSRKGAPQATLVSTETVPVENLQCMNKSAGRALDLYV